MICIRRRKFGSIRNKRNSSVKRKKSERTVCSVTEMLIDNLHTRHRLSPWFILYNCSIIVYSMTFIRRWVLGQSAVTRKNYLDRFMQI